MGKIITYMVIEYIILLADVNHYSLCTNCITRYGYGSSYVVITLESITPVVLELDVNSHFSATTCGIHRSGVKTWLGHANTLLIAFIYDRNPDEAYQRGAGPAVIYQTVKERSVRALFSKTASFFRKST